MRSLLFTTVLALGLATACSSKHHATPGKLTKADLTDAMQTVFEAYPAPYAETLAKITADLGPPMKSEPNLESWFASDGGCWQLFVTKASKDAAAANVSEANKDDARYCK